MASWGNANRLNLQHIFILRIAYVISYYYMSLIDADGVECRLCQHRRGPAGDHRVQARNVIMA